MTAGHLSRKFFAWPGAARGLKAVKFAGNNVRRGDSSVRNSIFRLGRQRREEENVSRKAAEDAKRIRKGTPAGKKAALFLLFKMHPVELGHALRAQAVGEFRVRAVADIGFYLGPGALVVADLLAVRANGQKSPQRLDFPC